MPVNTIAMPASSAAAITSASRTDPPGWMTAVAPASIGGDQAVGEREEGVGGDDRAPGARLGQARHLGGLLGLARGEARGIDPRHLSRADAHRRAVPGVDDGVRLHVLGDRQANLRSAISPGVGARLVTTLSASSSSAPLSRSWTRRPPATDRTVSVGARGSGRAPASRSRRFFFAADDRQRLLVRRPAR